MTSKSALNVQVHRKHSYTTFSLQRHYLSSTVEFLSRSHHLNSTPLDAVCEFVDGRFVPRVQNSHTVGQTVLYWQNQTTVKPALVLPMETPRASAKIQSVSAVSFWTRHSGIFIILVLHIACMNPTPRCQGFSPDTMHRNLKDLTQSPWTLIKEWIYFQCLSLQLHGSSFWCLNRKLTPLTVD